eukprot:3571083-Pleurochrysis_carterae.AAC.1
MFPAPKSTRNAMIDSFFVNEFVRHFGRRAVRRVTHAALAVVRPPPPPHSRAPKRLRTHARARTRTHGRTHARTRLQPPYALFANARDHDYAHPHEGTQFP